MAELEDLSGPFNPNLKFEDFSKEFLLKLMKTWQWAWLHAARAWYEAIQEKFGSEAANECERAAWLTIGERVNPRYAKVANIEVNTVLDSLKALQLPLDNMVGGLFPVEYDIKSPNDVVVTITNCPALLALEKSAPERIVPMCHILEKVTMEKYVLNPDVQVIPLKLPPRKSPDEIACQWEFKLEA